MNRQQLKRGTLMFWPNRFAGGLLAAACLLVAVVEGTITSARAAAPRISNGVVSQDFPAVGLLQLASDGSNGVCSGTMVGCDTFLTAAHCVCETEADTAADCVAGGIIAPGDMTVFLQHGGQLPVRSVEIHPDYNFGTGGDLAVLKLATPMTGILPLPINRVASPALGTPATLVGFGTTGLDNSVGIKRWGKATVAACTDDHPGDRNVCWSFREPQGAPGSNSDTCEGDSGGPLIVSQGGGAAVAGVTSGGSSFSCLPPDDSFDSDVFFHRSFIIGIGGTDLDSTRCGDLPHVGEAGVSQSNESDTLGLAGEGRYSVQVPAATRLLRIGLNADTGESRRGNDFDLYLRREANPTSEEFDCGSTSETGFEFCEIVAPQPGTWNILVEAFRGQGEIQLTTTMFAGCLADCDGDGSTDADNLNTAIDVSLERAQMGACGAADNNADNRITIEDLVTAVEDSDGCAAPSSLQQP